MFSPRPDSHRKLETLYKDLNIGFYWVPEEPQSRNVVPAMTHDGFRKWMTLMVEAFPDQEHERLNKVMATMEIRNGNDHSERYPSRLPRQLLPLRSNPDAHARVRYAIFETFDLSVPGIPVVQVHGSHGGGGLPNDEEQPIRAVVRNAHTRSVSRGRVPPRLNIPDGDDDDVFTEGGPGVGNLSAGYTGAMGSLSSPNRSRAASSHTQGRLKSGLTPEADRVGRSRGATIGARYESPLRSPNTPASVPDDSWHQSPPPSFNLGSHRAERSPASGRQHLGYRDSGESLFGRRY